MTPDEANDIANRVADLREACNTCRSVWQTQQVFLSKETAAAVNGALSNSAGRINTIEKNIFTNENYSKLVAKCAVEHDLYSGPGNLFQAMDTSAFSFGRFWNEVVAPTAEGVVTGTKDTLKSADSAIPFLAVGLVAIAIIILFK